MSVYRNRSSQLSDIRHAPRPPVSAWPEADLGKLEEWYTEENLRTPLPPIWQERYEKVGQPPRAFAFARPGRRSVILGLIFCLALGVVFGALKAREIKKRVENEATQGYQHLALAVDHMQAEQFDSSLVHFNEAYQAFDRGSKELTVLGGIVADATRFIPPFSEAASGKHALEAGRHFAAAGIPLARIAEELSFSQETYAQGGKISLLDFTRRIKIPLGESVKELDLGNQALEKVRINDIPEDKREPFLSVRRHLPVFIGMIKKFEQNEKVLEEILGGNGPRKYLFLLQNNHELRATGGFIGSYALLDMRSGVVRRFFVDGIFNPDGQLKENIIPPKPIQKISAAWSLHDSNWFPDFPTSAEKAIFFYEKTGGPTVDGIITLTPNAMQKLLLVTGPIALPQYGLEVDAENFIPVIQEQVETKYDKEENQPKKVLADLFALLLEKVFASQDKGALYQMAEALTEGLNEKHILLYSRHSESEALIDEAGWSGRMLPAARDYLSVIHTNINGYKTDGVIDEKIKHQAEIGTDGSIIDTVSITRTHRGGQTPYEWWNKVNADYLRVYVPIGSELISAKGTTWEFSEPPLDYLALGFRRDQDVEREEQTIVIDEKSGTRVYQDAGKTVFGAWVYVSPQESVTVEYRYRLPFRLIVNNGGDDADSYSILFQKQSGSPGSTLISSVVYPERMRPIWQVNGNLLPYGREWKLESELKTDVFAGMVFSATDE